VILWIAMATLTALTLGLLLRPLLRPQPTASAARQPGLAVYRDQLGELERDLAAGRIPAAEAEAARREIERRLLAAAAAPAAVADRPPARHLALLLLAALPAAALALYLGFGRPDLPARPLAGRSEEIALAWRNLAIELVLQGDTDAAVRAFELALAKGAPPGESLALLADAVITKNAGQVTAMARRLLAAALEADPGNLLALFLSALALQQDGQLAPALELMTTVAELGGGTLPWEARLQAAIAALRERQNLPQPAP